MPLPGGVALAAVVLCDDRYGLSRRSCFVAQLAVAVTVVVSLRGLDRFPLASPLDHPLCPLARPPAVPWIVAVVNFFNYSLQPSWRRRLRRPIETLAFAFVPSTRECPSMTWRAAQEAARG